MSRLRRLLDPGADAEAHARAGRAAREDRLHLRHRLQQPLSVLHEHLRLPQHPRPRAHDRHRAARDEPGAQGLRRHRRRRRPEHRRQPPAPRHAPQRRHQDRPLQQPHLRTDEGPVLADVGVRQAHQELAGRCCRHAAAPAQRRDQRGGVVRRPLTRHRPEAPVRDTRARRPAQGDVVRRGLPELQRLQRRRLHGVRRQGRARRPHGAPGARTADGLRQGA